jgi:antitoxin CptB
MSMDDRQIERLKWRSRRGLLELDLVFTGFWEKNEHLLSEQDMRVLDRLLQLSDNDILDMVMTRQPVGNDTEIHEIIRRLQQG